MANTQNPNEINAAAEIHKQKEMLLAQDHYVQAVAKAHQEACDLNGRKWAKDERLRELLKAPHLRRVPKRSKGGGGGGSSTGGVGGVAEGLLAEITGGGGGGGSVPMPLDPTVQVRVDRAWNGDVFTYIPLDHCIIRFIALALLTFELEMQSTGPLSSCRAARAFVGSLLCALGFSGCECACSAPCL